MRTTTPFHPGEREVQERMGVREAIEPFARRVVRPFMPDEHREFFSGLPFVAAAARDDQGRPWATLLAGAPGFLSTPDDRTLDIAARPSRGDALEGCLQPGADIGLLGIEFDSRRRNRLNGRLAVTDGTGLRVTVDQTFGNCPQYIQPREWRSEPAQTEPAARRYGSLTEQAAQWISQADTFLIATGHRAPGDEAFYGMDASHRGGEPGFVTVVDADTLSFPDYAGNNHFNTIGNLLLDPRVGLLFVDFQHGHLLQLTGTATIDWDSPAVTANPGARRLVNITVEEVVEVRHALPITWGPTADAIRSVTVVDRVRESRDTVSFLLAPRDGGELPAFKPGQYLPLNLQIPGQAVPVSRTYSLSAAAQTGHYRVTVKRQPGGLASNFLHDAVLEGATLGAGRPAGDFILRPGERPVALVSAGVGVTPMVAMLGQLSNTRDPREAWFIHGARDSQHHSLAREVQQLCDAGTCQRHISYSSPLPGDRRGVDYQRIGRVDAELLTDLLPLPDVDIYLCGPLGFMSELHEGLLQLEVPPERIFSETFGPQG